MYTVTAEIRCSKNLLPWNFLVFNFRSFLQPQMINYRKKFPELRELQRKFIANNFNDDRQLKKEIKPSLRYWDRDRWPSEDLREGLILFFSGG